MLQLYAALKNLYFLSLAPISIFLSWWNLFYIAPIAKTALFAQISIPSSLYMEATIYLLRQNGSICHWEILHFFSFECMDCTIKELKCKYCSAQKSSFLVLGLYISRIINYLLKKNSNGPNNFDKLAALQKSPGSP